MRIINILKHYLHRHKMYSYEKIFVLLSFFIALSIVLTSVLWVRSEVYGQVQCPEGTVACSNNDCCCSSNCCESAGCRWFCCSSYGTCGYISSCTQWGDCYVVAGTCIKDCDQGGCRWSYCNTCDGGGGGGGGDTTYHTVTYNANGGTCTKKTEKVADRESSLGPGTCTRTGYVIKDFTRSAGGCESGWSFTAGTCRVVIGALTVTANWTVSCTPTCSLPACPSGYSTTDSGCRVTSCPSGWELYNGTCRKRNSDGCGGWCAYQTCYRNAAYTSAPATPISTNMRIGSTNYNLSTSASTPSIMDYRNGGVIKVFTNVVPSGAYYSYQVYNAYSGGSTLLNYEGTTQVQPGSGSLTYTDIGRFDGRHWYYKCHDANPATKLYSGSRTGYYCMETNVAPPSSPDNLTMTIDGQTYTLSSSSGNPTVVKYPSPEATKTNTKVSVFPTRSTSSTAAGSGYRVETNNYGLNGEWNAFSCGRDEDFCTEGTGNVMNFSPNTLGLLEVLKQGAKGGVDGLYYNENKCDSNKVYSQAASRYYRVNNNPSTSCPVVMNTVKDSISPRGCQSTIYTGSEVNNPLKFRVEGTDVDGNDEIRGAVIWLSKEGMGDQIPKYPGIFPGYSQSDPNHIGIMMLKDGSNWIHVRTYASDSEKSNQWGDITADRRIKNNEGEWMVAVSPPVINQTDTQVTFDLELTFNAEISLGGYPEGNYEVNAIVFDKHMILGGNTIDQYYMLKNCRAGGWNIDLKSPELELSQSGNLARQLDLKWSLDGTGSGITNAVINAYSDSTGDDVVYLSPKLELEGDTISLSSSPASSDIGHLTDTNSWKLTNDPPNSPYESSATIGIGDNEEGMIIFYVTGFDQACNDTLGSETVNLNPWITAKGGLVYSGGSVGVNAKDVSAQEGALKGMLTRVKPEELDIGTELVSSRDDYIRKLIRPEQQAVRAHSVFNSTSRNTWFEYLKGKLELYKSGLESFQIPINNPPNTISALCGDKPCYMETTGTVKIPKNFVCDGKALIMVDGDIHIEPDIVNGSTQTVRNPITGKYEDKLENNIEGCIFVASGDITIGAGDWKTGNATGYEEIRYDYIEAFMVAGNKIDIQLVDIKDSWGDPLYMRDGLEIHGGLVAFGNNLNPGESAVQVNRSLALFNNYLPTVVTSWDPRYAKLSEIFFGTSATMYKREVGFKAF